MKSGIQTTRPSIIMLVSYRKRDELSLDGNSTSSLLGPDFCLPLEEVKSLIVSDPLFQSLTSKNELHFRSMLPSVSFERKHFFCV